MGLLCGLATACKATPLLFLPMLLLRGRWQAAGMFVAACLLASFLPDVLCPAKSGRAWSEQWYSVFVSKVETSGPAAGSKAWRAWNHLNQGLAGTLYRFTTPAPVDSAERIALEVNIVELSPENRRNLTLGALGLLFASSLAVTWLRCRLAAPLPRNLMELGTWSVLFTAMLLLSPMSSKQHFCTLLVPLAYVCDYLLDAPKRQYLLLVGLGLVWFMGSCLMKDIVGRPLGNLALAYGSLTWCALVCWAMAIFVLWQDRKLATDSGSQ